MICGIDWSDRVLEFHLIGPDGQSMDCGSVTLTIDGLTELFERLEKHGSPSEVAVAIEATQGPWVQAILDRGYPLYSIPPAAADAFRRSLSPTGKKSDGFDSQSNALYVSSLGHTMKPLRPDAPEIVAMRESIRDRNRLVEDRTAKTNDLRSQLKRYYPAFIGFFGDLTSHVALAFLCDFPTQDAMHSLTPRRLRSWLKRHHYKQTQRIDAMVAMLSAPVLPVAAHLQQAKAAHLRYQASTIMSLDEEIDRREAENEKAYRQLPESKMYDTLPGAGRTLAPALLACFGRDPDRYESPTQARAFMGTAPVTRSSGRQRSVFFRRGCCKFARRTMQLFAQQSMRESAWAKAYYKKQRQKATRHHTAIRALANKWVKIILAMKRDQSCYNEARYVTACEKHLSETSTILT